MASSFKNYVYPSVGTSNTTIYNPTTSGIQSTIIGLTVSNRAAVPITVSVMLTSGANTGYVVKDAVVPVGGALVPVGGDQKIVVMENNSVVVSANTTSSADCILSVLEIT